MQEGHCKNYEPVLECKAGVNLKALRFNAVPCFHADRPCPMAERYTAEDEARFDQEISGMLKAMAHRNELFQDAFPDSNQYHAFLVADRERIFIDKQEALGQVPPDIRARLKVHRGRTLMGASGIRTKLFTATVIPM